MAATDFQRRPIFSTFLGTADPRKEREIEQSLKTSATFLFRNYGAWFCLFVLEGKKLLLEVGDQLPPRIYFLSLKQRLLVVW